MSEGIMSEEIEFPVIGLGRDGLIYVCLNARTFERIRWGYFTDEDYLGVEMIDATGKAWRIMSAELASLNLGWYANLFGGETGIAYKLKSLPSRDLETVKAQIIRRMKADPDAWVQSECIDRKKGIWLEKEAVLERELAKIRATRDMAELCAHFGPLWF
jgi:hypothetical protein